MTATDYYELLLIGGPLDGERVVCPGWSRVVALSLGRVTLPAWGWIGLPDDRAPTDQQLAASAYLVIYQFEGLERRGDRTITFWSYAGPLNPRPLQPQ